jgi:trimeric autotransporter adhesin
MRKLIIFTIVMISALTAETLFEVKDASNNKVLDVSTDGIRVMNFGDTLMVISSSEIKANLDNSKGLSRSFSVSTTTSKGTGTDLMKLTSDSTRFWISDTGSGFGVEAQTTAKGESDKIMRVTGDSTRFWINDTGSGFGISTKSNEVDTMTTNISRYNTLIGQGAGFKLAPTISGWEQYNVHNTIIGFQAGFNSFGALPGDATRNIFIGGESGFSNNTGNYNIYLGNRAGWSGTSANHNVVIGHDAGIENQTGTGNVFIGNQAGFNETGSNKLYIENSKISTPLIWGNFDTDEVKIYGTLYSANNMSTSGTLTVADNTALNGTLTVAENTTMNGTYMKMTTNPGTGTIPTNYFYQGAVGSTSKQYAFSIYDALWVTGNTFFDANATVGGVLDINGTSNEAIKVDGLEALWLGQNASLQNYFSWGYGALYNYFADRVTIGNAGYNSSYMLYVAGNAYATGSWSSSDKRFKKNITGIDNALDKISGINGVKYEWRKDEFADKGFAEGQHYGVIAQDLEKVIPEAVSTDSDGYKAVSYNDLVPILVEAVKELKAENESLKTRLETVEKTLKK